MQNISSFFSSAAQVASKHFNVLDAAIGHYTNGRALASNKEIAVSATASGVYLFIASYGLTRFFAAKSPAAKCFYAAMAGSSLLVGTGVLALTAHYFISKDCLMILANAMSLPKDSICHDILSKSIVYFCPKRG